MRTGGSIRTRLMWAAAGVLLVFLVSAGWVVQRAHTDSVQAQHFAQLQSTVYLLMAQAELDPDGRLQMPMTLTEPRLSLPRSGLYATITGTGLGLTWQSRSALDLQLPHTAAPPLGQWLFTTQDSGVSAAGVAPARALLSASLAVQWAVGSQRVPLVFTAFEDRQTLEDELHTFGRTLWSWLTGTGVVLLVIQTLLLRWAFRPLGQMAQEVQRVEHGQQSQLTGNYPQELAGLARNLNLLIDQQRQRQSRYRQALDDLAHSLKTPLAALRATLNDPSRLSSCVAEQVDRMDDIVVRQLSRAGASGHSAFAPAIKLAPVVQRLHATLDKVHADRHLYWTMDCPETQEWRMDAGDAFEMLGNLMDNAAKWARQHVVVTLQIDPQQALSIQLHDDGPGFADPTIAGQRRVRQDEQVPGYGIGLAVVKELVDSYGGSLKVCRSTLGGAQVHVLLPDTPRS